MNTVKLNNGLCMPLVGLGTSKDVPEKIEAAVYEALKIGYRLIDTAFFYANEKYVGNALAKSFDEGILTREDVFIITKLPPIGHAKDKVSRYLESQLKELQLTRVDLYLVHMPTPLEQSKHDIWPTNQVFDFETWEPVDTDHLETWRAMEECVDKGLTKSIGLSNFNSKQIQNIFDNCRIKPSNLQVECHLYMQQSRLFRFCQKLDITFTAYAPLGSPAYKKHLEKENRESFEAAPLLEDETLLKLAIKYSKTMAQVALRFLVQRGTCVIPKSVTIQRLKENFDIFGFTLSDNDMSILEALDKNQRHFTYLQYSFLAEHPEYPFVEEF